MTKQEIYERVRDHFSVPGTRMGYSNSAESCVYRGGNNPVSPVRCAFGVLIPDELYEPKMENTLVGQLLEQRADLRTALGLGITSDVIYFLGVVQDAHDGIAADMPARNKRKRFLQRLDRIAAKHGLDVVKAA
jgi:hypothetical protein